MSVDRLKLKGIIMSKLFLLILFINFSVFAEQQVFFEHQNKEHSLTYYGDAKNPSGIVLKAYCDPSYCDPSEEFVEQFTSFITAFRNNELYYYKYERVSNNSGGHCDPFQHCVSPRKLSIKKVKAKFSGYIDNFLQGFSNEIGSQTAQQLSQKVLNDNALKTVDLIVIRESESGDPIGICQIKEGTCVTIDEVKFYAEDNIIAAEIHNFDINDAFDRLVENSIEDFFYKVYTSIKCVRGTAGPAGENVTTQLICYIPK